MRTVEYAAAITEEIHHTVGRIHEQDADQLISSLLESQKVFIAGAGRSGFMAKSFAMRLMHMGIHAYVVGETITPGIEQGDLLIVGSGSGETKSLLSMAEKAKALNATVTALTINTKSTLAKLSDHVIQFPAQTKSDTSSQHKTIQPMGSLFEQSLLVFYDAIILGIMSRKQLDSATMYGKHANLE